MNGHTDPVEQRLIAGYRQQASQYDRALHIIAAHQSEAHLAGTEKDWVQEVLGVLQVLADLDAGLSEAKAAWRQAGRVPGAELSAILDGLGGQLRVLAGHIDGQVADLLARKERLVPEIDAFIRQRWMMNAYGQHRPAPAKA